MLRKLLIQIILFLVLFSCGDNSSKSLKNDSPIENDEDIEANYLKGKYGALPFLGDFDNTLNR